jgi:hypothetical protein
MNACPSLPKFNLRFRFAPFGSPDGAKHESLGQRPGFSTQQPQALKGRDNAVSPLQGLSSFLIDTQGVALGYLVSPLWG